MSPEVQDAMLADALAGRFIIVDIGQIDPPLKKRLQREVKAGRLAKWRGYWYPIAGASWGIGPPKTCYGKPLA